MQTFAELFDAANGGAIEYEGRQLHQDYSVDVAEGDRIVLEFLRSVERPVQGLGIKCEKCEISVAATVSNSVVLWTDTAPANVELKIVKARLGAGITIVNQWRDEKYGSTMYRLNNAAIEVLPQEDASAILRCSDGWGEHVDFNDLVVHFTKTHNEAIEDSEVVERGRSTRRRNAGEFDR